MVCSDTVPPISLSKGRSFAVFNLGKALGEMGAWRNGNKWPQVSHSSGVANRRRWWNILFSRIGLFSTDCYRLRVLVAQLDSASASEAEGCWFEPSRGYSLNSGRNKGLCHPAGTRRRDLHQHERCRVTPFTEVCMSRSVPKYRRHPNGQAFVQHRSIENPSHRMYLGSYGTPESKRRYRQFLTQLEVSDNAVPRALRCDRTISDLTEMRRRGSTID